jgi:hypothetical protein
VASSRAALSRKQRRWADVSGVRYDARGYVTELGANLREPLSSDALAELARGSELAATAARPPRLLSLTSSAALVVNVFGWWRDRDAAPLSVALGLGADGGLRVTFEEPLPTGLAGEPPLADVALRWPDGRLVAIESKLGEWLVRRPRSKTVFKDKYFPPSGAVWSDAGLPRCQSLADDLQRGRERPKLLHAAQLLKHALGLAKSGARAPTLLYLYFDCPGREAATHRSELDRILERLVPEIDLRVETYQELYRALCATPGLDPDYLSYLARRYFD